MKTLRYFGNTANNAFYLQRIAENLKHFNSPPTIMEYGFVHGFSSPAWENVDFELSNPDWPNTPIWSEVEGASEWARCVEQESPPAKNRFFSRIRELLVKRQAVRDAIFLLKSFWFKPIHLGKREIGLVFGPNFLSRRKFPKLGQSLILFEHGTIRWAGSPSATVLEKVQKARYRGYLKSAAFVLVTNLDPETLDCVDRFVPGAWCAFPHPYIPSGLSPRRLHGTEREGLLSKTKSRYLILLGASHNWDKSHDKGTQSALEAFRFLRASGRPVGLITLEWGNDVEKSKDFLLTEGLADFVAWLPPQPRLPLLRLTENVDLSWNQFGYDSIGAFDLRMIEAGLPHVSRGLTPRAVQLVGSQVPWSIAATADEISTETIEIISNLKQPGYLSGIRSAYDSWYSRFHSPDLTRRILSRVLENLEEGVSGQRLAPNVWQEEAMRQKH